MDARRNPPSHPDTQTNEVAIPVTAAGLKVVVLDGPGAGTEVGLMGKLTVGSASEADLVLDDDTVSRQHMVLSFSEQRVRVRDLGSRNGTFVNGARLEHAVRLEPGDRIEVGDHRFAFGEAPELACTVYAEATVAATRAHAPERLRLVYELTQLVEAPAAEIAAVLGVAEGTIKSRLHAATSAFRAQLAKGDAP